MDGEQKPSQNHSDSAPPPPPQITEPEGATPQEPATAQQLNKVEQQMTSFERSTLRWARAAVIMSGLAAIFVCAQWIEMCSGATDTHNLAVAARNQATWTRNLATNMQTQADRTKDLADRMKDQTDQTKSLAEETQTIAGQAVVQARATLAGTRAWVAPEAIELGSAIEDGLPFRYQVEVTNPGKEPAQNVVWNIKPRGVPYIQEGASTMPSFGRNITCAGLVPRSPGGFSLYPQGIRNFKLPLDIPDTPANQTLLRSVQAREKSLMIDGCFAYITAGQAHTSAFRFFLRDVPGPSVGIDDKGNRVARWNFNIALDGNEAN